MIPQIRLLPYEQLFKVKLLQSGTYIFSDIERLNPKQAEIAAQAWEDLSKAGESVRLLNHPTQSMRRYQLLRTLYEKGYNKFNIYRLTEYRIPQKFPVFIRGENDHDGSITSLLQTPEELDNAVSKIFEEGQSLENKVIIEFCDTSDSKGVFRKYSALIVGTQIIPRHIIFSYNWMLKKAELVWEEMLLEEKHYLENNPHESLLKEIFQLARINYGRIDYSILDGTIQVWEINTNPGTLWAIDRSDCSLDFKRLSFHEDFAQKLNSAFQVINCNTNPAIQVNTSVGERFFLELSAKQSLTELIIEPLPYRYQLVARKKLRNLRKIIKSVLKV